MYQYKVVAFNVVDGDTVDLELDLGFQITTKDRYRLYGPNPNGKIGINAPERYTPEGKLATDHLYKLLEDDLLNGTLVAHTVKDRKEKYGRYLVVLIGSVHGNINQRMLIDGHAVEKEY